jgi:hypothetical protein
MLGSAGVIETDTSVSGVTIIVVDPDTFPDAAAITVKPADTEVARPLEPAALLIAATAEVDELHAAAAVRSCVVLSEYIHVAVNCRVVPTAIEGFSGVTTMDTSVAGVIVSAVESDTLPIVAVSVVRPVAAEVAKPLEPALLLTVATLSPEEVQATAAVTSCVVLSENVPVAVNCCAVPSATLELAGVIDRDMSVAGVIVSAVESDTLSTVAVIVVGPVAAEVAKPLEPAALLTVAASAVDEFQIAVAVRSLFVLSV